MKNNISLIVGLKNNLNYSKFFYKTTRQLYPKVEICFVSYGSTDGTHEWLDSLNDPYVKYYYSKENKTFSDTYNKTLEISTKEYVIYLHNDIILTPNFIENLQKHFNKNNAVSYTTIEPPIFSSHERPGKIIKDFGLNIDSLLIEDLYKFSYEKSQENKNKTEEGITFFMGCPKDVLLKIGGMDNLFNPMFCEDDDLIRRLKLLGLKCFTSLDSICYHFVSKTSRFSNEFKNKSNEIELNSNKNFIRKWGDKSEVPKYDIGFIIKNCRPNFLSFLEIFCSNIYTDMDPTEYIKIEQPHTKYSLKDKIKNINDPHQNDILVYIDGLKITDYTLNIILKLPLIIKDSGDIGEFEVDNLKIKINSMKEYQNELIYLT